MQNIEITAAEFKNLVRESQNEVVKSGLTWQQNLKNEVNNFKKLHIFNNTCRFP